MAVRTDRKLFANSFLFAYSSLPHMTPLLLIAIGNYSPIVPYGDVCPATLT